MSTYEKTRAWCRPADLPEERLELFRQRLSGGLTRKGSEMKPEEQIYHEAMIASIRSEMKGIRDLITIPYAVFLTDQNGVILELVCSSPELREELVRTEFGTGVSLCRQQSGMNAVSLAMEMSCIGVVRGEEHSDPKFADWNCICAPVQSEGRIYGYVDVSFHKKEQIEFAIPFVQQIAQNITGKWMERNPAIREYRLESRLQHYKLSAREQDVARQWLLERSALHISNELGISEGTVRNVLKNIYSKMRVSDRLQFIRKLTGDID
ncbi:MULTISPECIES: LuxR C-terminal-related transcriptional regulator [unclassified Paenibacillus]|uniref:LuxR C-terminal-related transcriptional regulator n=1 Tax=unclassified Paenibacillus TaxID=185978 RepID=UPI002407077A|nr:MULTISPECIES: LuxR C-terminal-related transcriptional regulator [unclassified Paenibacillus]MDF9840192.1 transcriptional regulator of acetoin/glycerol metabolism [Paenibacillus sp. PastF-2]MDF9846774.1 transcriptional regulator of acetoin/glycerol metabolism [Paenibacillus sp. PastM-2]MDF9852877.1 transcriptional regulator of acetoin/glycerol metabolism [Paenibacillus sp. PastF-1]MDH6478618.1 transcriptional regulator of acetoin/glycerol metabolism [Paenibacillus sp. PastH-2]MDH6505884.1 tr